MRVSKLKQGDVIEIGDGAGMNYYAVSIRHDARHFAFLNCRSRQKLSVEKVADSEILFVICVERSAVRSKDWQIFGHMDLPQQLLEPILFFRREIGTDDFVILNEDWNGLKYVDIEDVRGLEPAAAWAQMHLLERLSAHFENRESLNLKVMLPVEWEES